MLIHEYAWRFIIFFPTYTVSEAGGTHAMCAASSYRANRTGYQGGMKEVKFAIDVYDSGMTAAWISICLPKRLAFKNVLRRQIGAV